MFEQVTREQRRIDREERGIISKIDNGKKKKKTGKSPTRDQVIKAAQLFATADEERKVEELIVDAKKSEKMKEIAKRASIAAAEEIERSN